MVGARRRAEEAKSVLPHSEFELSEMIWLMETIKDTMDDGKQTEVQFEQVVKKMGQQIQQGPEGAAADGSRGHHFQALARVGYGCWKCVVVRRVSSSSHRAGG